MLKDFAEDLFNEYQKILFENLRSAWLKARKGKTSKTAVKNFSRNVNNNLQILHDRMVFKPASSFSICTV